jgi:hypothetical protein
VAASAAGTGPSLLTAEACRLRWADLDAEQWSEGQGQGQGHDAAPAPVHYKVPPPPMITDAKQHRVSRRPFCRQVYVKTSDLGPNGVQPDFATLASKVSGSMPKYLTPPTAFPSVGDMDDDEEEEEEEEGVEHKVMR